MKWRIMQNRKILYFVDFALYSVIAESQKKLEELICSTVYIAKYTVSSILVFYSEHIEIVRLM